MELNWLCSLHQRNGILSLFPVNHPPDTNHPAPSVISHTHSTADSTFLQVRHAALGQGMFEMMQRLASGFSEEARVSLHLLWLVEVM